MTINVPVTSCAPLDYRYALDAATTFLLADAAPMIICNVAELEAEIAMRVTRRSAVIAASAALWIEPLVDTWQTDLRTLIGGLGPGAPLIVVASRSLAGLLPERRSWHGTPLGLRPDGMRRLRVAARRRGLQAREAYGIHTAWAIMLSRAGQFAEQCGRPDIGDRLHFASRLRYCAQGPAGALAAVALQIFRKDR